jgi:hypothetical protein
MRVVLAITLAAFAGAMLAVPASATDYFAVNWYGSTRTINVTIEGYGNYNIGIAPAEAWLDNVKEDVFTIGGDSLNTVLCIDLFNYAYDAGSIRPGHAMASSGCEYSVDVHRDTSAGFTTPSGDEDERRDRGDLTRVAALANTWGRGAWLSTDTEDKLVALNVAIWQAAYGTRFTYNSGLTGDAFTPGTQVYYFANVYMPFYDRGYTDSNYLWYDNCAGDGTSTNQDFVEPIPEPATLLLLGSGLLGSGFVIMRRRKS